MLGKPDSLSDRLVAAILLALFVGVTLLALPLVLLVAVRGRHPEQLAVLFAHVHFQAWALAVVAAAAACGFVAGVERSTDLLAHLWGTATPRRPAVTLGLWAVIGVVALLTNLMAS